MINPTQPTATSRQAPGSGAAWLGISVSIPVKFTAWLPVKVHAPCNPVAVFVSVNIAPVVPARMTVKILPGAGCGLPSPLTVNGIVADGVTVKTSAPLPPFTSRPVRPTAGFEMLMVIVSPPPRSFIVTFVLLANSKVELFKLLLIAVV